MFDIDILRDLPPLGVLWVYFYRSGVIRQKLRAQIQKRAEQDGMLLSSYSVAELAANWNGEEIFPIVRFCQATDGQRLNQKDRSLLLSLCRAKPATPTVIFLPYDAELRQGVAQTATLIEEPAITARTLRPALNFLIETNALADERDLTGQGSFNQYFERFLKEAPDADLGVLSQEVDRAALLYVDRSTGTFELPADEYVATEQPSYIVRTLQTALVERDVFAIASFLRAVHIKAERGWSDAALADEFCRATTLIVGRRLAHGMSDSNLAKFDRNESAIWLWSILLLVWAEDIKRPAASANMDSSSHFLAGLDNLLRDYRRRSSDADPLVGKWAKVAALAKALAPIDESRWDHGYRLFQLLMSPALNVSNVSWIRTLRRIATEASNVPPTLEFVGAAIEEQRASPGAFSSLVGRDEIVADLRKRFRDNEHERPLVLVGHKQSGRRTIARLYAKSLLCEGTGRDDGSPCGDCSSCRNFDNAPGFGYIEIDLSHPDALSHVAEHVEALKGVPLSERRIIILRNPEVNPGALELVLKPFENGVVVTSFVLTVTEVAKIKPALLSRSQSFVLPPLDDDETRQLLSKSLPAFVDERIFQLITSASSGLPGAIVNCAEVLNEAAAYDLQAAKARLGMEWGGLILDYWKSLLGPLPEDSAIIGSIRALSADDAVGHMRQFLWRLERRCCEGEAALIGLETEFGDLSDRLNAVANHAADTGIDLYGKLSEIWLADSIFGDEGLKTASSATNCMLKGFA